MNYMFCLVSVLLYTCLLLIYQITTTKIYVMKEKSFCLRALCCNDSIGTWPELMSLIDDLIKGQGVKLGRPLSVKSKHCLSTWRAFNSIRKAMRPTAKNAGLWSTATGGGGIGGGGGGGAAATWWWWTIRSLSARLFEFPL